jgi:hypothetical protein
MSGRHKLRSGGQRSGNQQTAVEGLGDGGGTVADTELAVDAKQVGLDRGLAECALAADTRVGRTAWLPDPSQT